MKKAFIIEIGPEYPDPYKIYAPINDRTNWMTTLVARGFSNITSLIGLAATHSAILAQMTTFVKSLNSGDSGVVCFLGHGSQVTDTDGDETDHLDECYVTAQLQAVVDDEIGAVVAQLKTGAKLDVVMDCCHAGTGTRIINLDVPKLERFMSQDMTPHPKVARARSDIKAIVPVPSMNHRLWAACADNQISYAGISGGLMQSLFSLYLCWALRAYPAKNATELMNIVAPYVQAIVSNQVPQLEGANLTAIPF